MNTRFALIVLLVIVCLSIVACDTPTNQNVQDAYTSNPIGAHAQALYNQYNQPTGIDLPHVAGDNPLLDLCKKFGACK